VLRLDLSENICKNAVGPVEKFVVGTDPQLRFYFQVYFAIPVIKMVTHLG
jgi:hypothetical protein